MKRGSELVYRPLRYSPVDLNPFVSERDLWRQHLDDLLVRLCRGVQRFLIAGLRCFGCHATLF